MNIERPSSGNGSWSDANAAFLGTTRKKIDFTNGESQCRPSRRSADGCILNGVSSESWTESLNGVEETSPIVHVTPFLTILRHRLHGQIARRHFRQICRSSPVLQHLLDMEFGKG